MSHGAGMHLPADKRPGLSLAERDRRWQAIRELLERVDAGALVIPGRDAARADVRYLTDFAAVDETPCWLVFPRDGSPVLVFAERPVRDVAAGCWVDELVVPAASPREVIGERWHASAPGKQRVAVLGLVPDSLSGDAAAPAPLIAALRDALPGVEMVEVANELRLLRSVKSDEETNLLRHSARLLDVAFGAMDAAARPELPAHALWAVGIGALSRLGSELARHSRWAASTRPRALARPAHGLLARGMVATCELEAVTRGYAARAIHALAIGSSGPVVRELYGLVGELWDDSRAAMQPEVPLSALQRLLRARVSRLVKGQKAFRTANVWLTLHGAGLGADLPTVTGHSRRTSTTEQVQLGWVCGLEVSIHANIEGRAYVVSWADPVAITQQGAVRLGQRPPGFLATA